MCRPSVPKSFARLLAGAAFLLLAVPAVAANSDGVTPTEIVMGPTTDLSGVTAVQGVNNSDSIRMVFDNVNKAGGINGRRSATSWRIPSTPCRVPCRRSTSWSTLTTCSSRSPTAARR